MEMGTNQDRRADVIIIGAGVIGASCAYFLTRRGARVLLLERSHLAAGASGASAAMINLAPHSEVAEPLRPLNAESHRLIPEIEQDFDRIDTNHGSYQADWVVVAAGAHTPQLLSSIAPEIPVQPARGQVIITEAYPLITHRTIFFSKHLYVKQNLSGNFYLGSQTEFVGFEDRITMEQVMRIIKTLSRGIPLLTRLKALRCFAAFRPISADELPIIGAVPDCPRLIVASGHGRTGMRYSASTGKAVSELILDGKTELPMEAFAVERFLTRAQ